MGAFDTALKHTVWARDEGHCWVCGAGAFNFDIHHRLARKMGGANARLEWINWVSNLLTLHRGCHDWIEDNPKLARAAGWMLSDRQDPEDVLVWSKWEQVWCRLHGPELYKDRVSGLWAPHPEDEPRLWSELPA